MTSPSDFLTAVIWAGAYYVNQEKQRMWIVQYLHSLNNWLRRHDEFHTEIKQWLKKEEVRGKNRGITHAEN